MLGMSVSAVVGFTYYCESGTTETNTIIQKVNVPYEVEVIKYVENTVEVEKIVEVEKLVPVLVKPNIRYYPEIDFDLVMMNGVKFFEGFRGKRYKCCANVPTIGYGCTDINIVSRGTIVEEAAAKLLQTELDKVKADVLRIVKVDLEEHQLNALTSFTFNVGPTNLKRLVDGPNRLNSGNYKSVEEVMPMYRLAGGKVREGLVKRRAWEVALWRGEGITF